MLSDTMDMAACRAAIRAHPEEDGPRLEFADAADEQAGGLSPLGEYVRLSVELERLKNIRQPNTQAGHIETRRILGLEWRSSELEKAHRAEWLRVKCAKCGGRGKRSMANATLYEKADMVECPDCKGGDAGGLTWPLSPGVYQSHTGKPPQVEFRRGFPWKVTVPRLADCTRTKIDHDNPGSSVLKPSYWLAAACRHHPIEEVVAGDREPASNVEPGGTHFGWYQYPRAYDNAHVIPPAVWEHLEGWTHLYGAGWKHYLTRELAVRALATALAAFGHAGSPAPRTGL